MFLVEICDFHNASPNRPQGFFCVQHTAPIRPLKKAVFYSSANFDKEGDKEERGKDVEFFRPYVAILFVGSAYLTNDDGGVLLFVAL